MIIDVLWEMSMCGPIILKENYTLESASMKLKRLGPLAAVSRVAIQCFFMKRGNTVPTLSRFDAKKRTVLNLGFRGSQVLHHLGEP